MTSDSAPKSIDLAEEAPFALAGAEVRPATLEVIAGERRELLEPRVMQVLVALARRRGEMVSRDDLIEQCWAGRIVGEDAITRALAQLRKLAKSLGGFEIETVPRVAVRLVEHAADAPAPQPPKRRALLFAGLGLILLVLVGAAVWAWRNSLPIAAEEPTLAVRTFEAIGGDPQARGLAESLTDEVRGVLGETGRGFAIQGPGAAGPDADLVIRGTVSRQDGAFRVRAYLGDRGNKLTIWSESFEAPQTQAAALRDQVAVALANVAYAATEPSRQPDSGVDAQTLGLFVAQARGMSGARPEQGYRVPKLGEEIVARAPRFATGHAAFAVILAMGEVRYAPPPQRPALEARARAEAAEAIRLSPSRAGGAYDALHVLARLKGPDLAGAEDILLKGIATAPEHPFVHMRECRFLIEVGRAREAIGHCERARALLPLDPAIDGAYADALYAAGQFAAAQVAAERAVRFHPNHVQSLRVLLEISGHHGGTARARAALETFRKLPVPLPDDVARALELFYAARDSGSATDADRAMEAMQTALRAGSLDPRWATFIAAGLGNTDSAFAIIDHFGAAPPRWSVGFYGHILLERPAEALRRDPRFWPAAAKAGYVRYWLKRDKWPDFCSEPNLPFDCRKEAARAANVEPESPV